MQFRPKRLFNTQASLKRLLVPLMGCLLLLFALLVNVSCATQQESSPEEDNHTSRDTRWSYRIVNFTTADGVDLSGHLFGSGKTGVILAYMYPADQTSWHTTAQILADEGYSALTFDFRGYGESGGKKEIDCLDRDVVAALAAFAQAGVTSVVLMGASMGGTASLVAAEHVLTERKPSQEPSPAIPDILGVITLSAPVNFKGLSAADAVPRLTCPLLFIAAEEDVGADNAKELQQLAQGQGELHIVSGNEHGTNLLQGPQRDQVWQIMHSFLVEQLGTPR